MVFKQTPLYRYLMVCNKEHIEKNVFDGGAGGDEPFLSVFSSYGYKTTGIELDAGQLKKANDFGIRNNQNLNIVQGDLRNIKFPDECFSCVYSYNTIFHMMKTEVDKSMSELKRILKHNGLLFVNFLSINDFRVGEGKDFGNNQYEQMDDNIVIHSYYKKDEADRYFNNMQILYKENRIIERIYNGKMIKQGFIDYIAKKI